MYLLAINLYEIGQFLRILLWIFLPLFVIVLLITTYIHHRRKVRTSHLILDNDSLLLSMDRGTGDVTTGDITSRDIATGNITSEDITTAGITPEESEHPEGNNLYKGLLWMKQKFEEYREHTDQRIYTLKEQLEQKTTTVQVLQGELIQAREKIAELTGKLESNMNLLMNIHKELDRSLNVEKAEAAIASQPSTTPEAASGGLSSGE